MPLKSLHSDEYEAFLQVLIAARKDAGITQQDLAKALGKPQSFVSKYERRERRLDVVEFVAVARAIGLEPGKTIREIEARIASRSKQGTPR
ncbi:helix-turn-helix transcriptional regulator [Tepidamorphus gemmatus]|uniref:helix-turn-helix domain-containing protein n=1 Tax=Tepidamorphus gemmatus TaxID=747076 RepID=UPI00315D7BE8